MAQVKNGDRVRVHYTGRLDDGSVFDSSECHEDGCDCSSGPLEFVVGEGQVIPGFEQAVIGMAIGDAKDVTIPVELAYGERMDELVAVVSRSDVPPGMDPKVGDQLELTQEDGHTFPVLVTAADETSITLDANHPLAGRPLCFELKLVEIC